MWDSYPIGDRPLGWIELNENGWGAIAAWFAGPENVVREPMGERSDLVRVTCETADGTSSCWTETITGEVVQDIEDGIDSYLRDSGLPARVRLERYHGDRASRLDRVGREPGNQSVCLI